MSVFESFISLWSDADSAIKRTDMKKFRFLSLITVFVALIANFGTLSAQEQTTLKHFKTLKGHSYTPNSVSWNADGSCLASGANDGIVII